MPHLGPTELIIILVIVIAIFGAGKLSGLGGALGKGIKEFRTSVRDNSAASTATSNTASKDAGDSGNS